MEFEELEPCYVISIAAKLVGVHAQTLRYYEREGLVEPSRSRGGVRLYSRKDVDRLRQIKRLVSELGVNLAGVEIIIRLSQRIAALEEQLQDMQREIERLKEAGR